MSNDSLTDVDVKDVPSSRFPDEVTTREDLRALKEHPLSDEPSPEVWVSEIAYGLTDEAASEVAEQFNNLFDVVNDLPNSREKSLVITKLEEAEFWFTKSRKSAEA